VKSLVGAGEVQQIAGAEVLGEGGEDGVLRG